MTDEQFDALVARLTSAERLSGPSGSPAVPGETTEPQEGSDG